jgi:hypothetical protein
MGNAAAAALAAASMSALSPAATFASTVLSTGQSVSMVLPDWAATFAPAMKCATDASLNCAR